MASELAPAASVSGPAPLSTKISTTDAAGESIPINHELLQKHIADMKKIKASDIYFEEPDGRFTRLLIAPRYAIATTTKPFPQIIEDNKLSETLIKRHPSLGYWLQQGGKRGKSRRTRKAKKRVSKTRKH